MPRPLSNNALRAIMDEVTSEVFLLLVQFYYPTTGAYYRIVHNTQNVTSRGNVYTATAFDITFPDIDSRAPSGCTITVDNVGLELVTLLRSITQPLQVRVELVLASSPDTVELSLEDLVLRDVTITSSSIEGTLSSEDMLNQAFPGHRYEPRTFPGVF